MQELYDYISQGHEAEFTYNNEKYVIQPEVDNNEKTYWLYGIVKVIVLVFADIVFQIMKQYRKS